jgi:hypothetical protein
MYAKKNKKPMYGKGGMAKMLSEYMRGGMMKYPGGGMMPRIRKGYYDEGGEIDPKKLRELARALSVVDDRMPENTSARTAGGSQSLDVMMNTIPPGEDELSSRTTEPQEEERFVGEIPGVTIRPPKPVKKEERKEEPKDDPADFSGGKPAYEFMPTFDGNIQQTGARGEGTSGALSGVAMYFKGEDGRMQKVNTRLDDVPEYITKDPYFEQLLKKANRNYFELEREGGASKAMQAGKSPEAQMIGRILSGDITIEEAKRQANYQRQSF